MTGHRLISLAVMTATGLLTASCGGATERAACTIVMSNLCEDSLVVELVLPDGEAINNVSYSVTGNGIEEIAGWINTAAPRATASAWIAGMPAGGRYEVTMVAKTIGGDESCRDTAEFDLVQTPTSSECEGSLFAPRSPVGDNTCARLKAAVVAPLQTQDGQLIDVRVLGDDADGDFVEYFWRSTAGAFYYHYESDTRFECYEADTETITVEVSDDDFENCIERRAVRVSCVD